MEKISMCQSCSLPFNAEHERFFSYEPDGSRSMYCTNCYKDGAFVFPDFSMDDMIAFCVPIVGREIGEEAARREMNVVFPTLQRWKKA